MKELNIGYYVIVMASVIIILAGIKSASSIVVPFLLSMFIAIILSPFFNFLKDKKIPEGLSLLLVMGSFVLLIGLIGQLIGSSVNDFSAHINVYAKKLSQDYLLVVNYLHDYGIDLPIDEILDSLNAKRIMALGSSLLQGVGSIFSDGFIVLLLVVFMLLESTHFLVKIDYADGPRDTIIHIQEISSKIKRYMVIKALISLLTAFIIYLGLLAIGTEYAFLWAVLAFMFNFIPNIGSIIAALPAVLITLVQLGSMSAFLIAILYVSVNIVIGSIIEPKVMGRGLGLSTLVVFISLLFWGWLLGIVGMLLSIPLTIMAKIAFDAHTNTKWISVLLGTGENLEEIEYK